MRILKQTLVLVLLGLNLSVGAADTDAGKVKLGKDEQAILELLNETRKKEKLEPLKLNAVLCKVARQHCENMAKQEKMSHQLDGKSVGDRVDAAGYDYRAVRENLAMAEGDADSPAPTPKDIHAMWMASKGHKANILASNVSEVGISMVQSKKGTYFYTQVFATARK